MTTKWVAPFERLSEQRRSDLFWILLLTSTIPALREDLLFPNAWTSSLPEQFALQAVFEWYWHATFAILAIVLAWVVAGVALTSGKRRRALAAAPFLTLLLAEVFRTVAAVFYPDLPLAQSFLGAPFGIVATVYTVSAFAACVYFVLRGEALSLPFVVFIGILIVWQQFDGLLAWPQLLIFVVAILVFRLLVEAFEQNLPLARDLGRGNLLSLAGRTFALWWPMLVLIAIGLWLSAQITDAAEDAMYDSDFVTPYCSIAASDAKSALPCRFGKPFQNADEPAAGADGLFLFADDFYPEDDARKICRIKEPAFESPNPAPPPHSFKCPLGEDEKWSLTRLGFFDSLDQSVVRRYDEQESELNYQIGKFERGVSDGTKDVDTAARELFGVVPDNTGLKARSCTEFPFVDCEAANIVIRGLNAAYKKKRREVERKFVAYVKGQTSEVKNKIIVETDKVRDRLETDLNEAETVTLRYTDRVRSASNVVRKVLFLWLIVVAIKSVLYVFARVIFDKSTDIDIDLLEHEGAPAEGKVSTRQEITIPGDYAHDIYYKANYQPLGPAARFSIPQWRASVMSRLRFGAWNMSRVMMPLDDKEGITFNSVEAEHLVDWELEEGEEVVFSYSNFVAMNENIQLRTVISLRVATLLLGRIVFHTARCTGAPGRLILRTRGKPATDAQVRRSIPAARLVAWNRYARFSVDSHLTLADIFLNGFNLRRSAKDDADGPQGILIVEADARDGGLLVGTLRFARNFLLPI